MKKIRKKLRKFNRLLVSLALVLVLAALCGFDREEDKVYDGAGLLSEEERSRIQQLLVESAEETGQDLILVTTLDNEGKNAEDYADDFYDGHKFGYEKENGSGVLLLIDMDGREVYISTAGTAIEAYTDGEIEATLDDLVPLLKEQDYLQVCLTFAEDAKQYLTGGESAENGYYDPDTDRFVDKEAKKESGWAKVLSPERIGMNLLAAFLISLVIVFLISRSRKTRMTVGSRTYLKDGCIGFRERSDRFTHTTVVTRQIPKDNGGASGGGCSSSHVSSGGCSHGGGGRSF